MTALGSRFMKFLPSILVASLAMLVGCYIGAIWGNNHGRFQAALEENKLAVNALKSEDHDLPPAFREYLKGRIYYNIASKFPNDRGYLLRRDWDFGPVDLTVLKRRLYAKDLYDCDSYDRATAHLSDAEPDTRQDGTPAALID